MKITDKTKFFISTIFIIIAFFLWYLFNYLQNLDKINNLENKEHYIVLEELKTKYKLKSEDNNTYIYYNDEKLQNLDIKK